MSGNGLAAECTAKAGAMWRCFLPRRSGEHVIANAVADIRAALAQALIQTCIEICIETYIPGAETCES